MKHLTLFCLALLFTLAQHASAAADICTANLTNLPLPCPAPPTQHGKPSVRHDRYGVAHITAQSSYDLYFQIGIEDARDRLVQLEFFRRSASGHLAEVFGKGQISGDIDSRTNLYTEEERAYFFTTLPCDLQLALHAYADGINYYVDRIYRGRHKLVPHEFFGIGELVKLMTPAGLPGGTDYSLVEARGETAFKPGPWKVADSVAIAGLLVSQFGGGGGRQLRHAALLSYLTQLVTKNGDPTPAATARDIFDDVRWVRDTKAPVSLPQDPVGPVITDSGTETWPAPPACPLSLPVTARAPRSTQPSAVDSLTQESIRQALDQIEAREQRAEQRRHDFGAPSLHGSNGWVVSGTRTSSGKPLLWGGPQEGFDVPNINNEVYGRTPDLAFGGMKIPGAPFVLIGITDSTAFTTTSGEMDNSTIYLETLDPTRAPADPQAADANYYFLLNGEYHAMDRRTEVIHFAGEVPTQTPAYGTPRRAPLLLNVFRVNDCDPQHFHGPVTAWDFTDPQHPHAFTYKASSWKNELSTLEGFARFSTAKTVAEFDAAVAKVISLHNFFYADQRGNIGYWSAGSRVNYPIGFDDRFPSDGTGSQEWQPNPDGSMYTPFSKSIYSINPPQGYVVNWNTKPAAEECVLEGNTHDEHWGPIYRSERIGFLLDSGHNHNAEDIRLIAKDIGTVDNSEDTVAPSASYFVPLISAAYDRLVAANSPLTDSTQHPLLAEAVATLDGWNQYLVDQDSIHLEDGHYDPAYSPFLAQPGMSILFQWWYSFRQNLFGGGMQPNSPYIGTINFADRTINNTEWVGETTYGMVVHALDGSASGAPQRFHGDYFGGHRDEMIIASLNDAIALLAGNGALPKLSYGTCDGPGVDVLGFNTNDVTQWGWRERLNHDFDCHGSLTSTMFTAGTRPTNFGKVATHNRSTYMQIVSLTQPLVGSNIIAPGESAFIRHRKPGIGIVAGHNGDQAELFRNFQYKPMRLP